MAPTLLEEWKRIEPSRPLCDDTGTLSEVTELIQQRGWKLKTNFKHGIYHVALSVPSPDGLAAVTVFKCQESKLAETLLSAYLQALKRDRLNIENRELEQRLFQMQERQEHYLTRLEQSHRLHGDTTMRLAQAIKLLKSKGIQFEPQSVVADELVG